MKSTRILLATLALSGAPLLATHSAFAAPATPATSAAPQIDARAVALLDQSVKAYAALATLSQKIEFSDSIGGAVQSDSSGSGILKIQRPDKARLQLTLDGESSLFVGDGQNLISQASPTAYQKQEVKGAAVLSAIAGAIPSAASLPLGALLRGTNPLSLYSGVPWEKATLIESDGMKGIAMQLPTQEGRNPVVFNVFLDPKTNLVARVEANTTITKAGEKHIAYSNVTTFSADNSAITPATFQYTPPAGAKLMTEADQPKPYDARLIVGAKPFPLTGKTLEKKSLSLDDYKGKVVLLDFWATWCGPCIGELPNVQANYKKYNSKGFDIIGISLDEDEAELRSLVKEKAMAWPEIFDGQGWKAGDAKTYGVQAIPFSLLIGKDGKIAAVNPRGDELEPAIKAALAK